LGAGNGAELFGIATSQHLPSKVHISDISDYNLEPLIQSLKTNYKFPTIQISTGSVLDTEYMSSLSIESYDLLSTNFLLNEILSKSKKDFVKLIHFITTRLKKGQQWMVIDTATNFSETVLNVDDGKRVRRLMIYELLDNIEKLEKLHGDDSCWFRPDRKLKYPVKIQSIRYFYRLYVKK
jgi:25S rRNA (uracil2843-N3)-methyltransferase